MIEIMLLLKAQREELLMLRSLIPEDVPYVDREYLEKIDALKTATDAAAKAQVNWDKI